MYFPFVILFHFVFFSTALPDQNIYGILAYTIILYFQNFNLFIANVFQPQLELRKLFRANFKYFKINHNNYKINQINYKVYDRSRDARGN